jgi:hypothetical protein
MDCGAMSKHFDTGKYGIGSYDDFFCLRPPWLLIASLLFMCRSLAALALFGMTGADGDSTLSRFFDTEMLGMGALAAVPALLVLYALGARVPSAPSLVRWIWRHGRGLVAASALLHIAVAATHYASVRAWIGGPLAVQALALGDLAVIGYVFLSSHVRQAFLEFPAR